MSIAASRSGAVLGRPSWRKVVSRSTTESPPSTTCNRPSPVNVPMTAAPTCHRRANSSTGAGFGDGEHHPFLCLGEPGLPRREAGILPGHGVEVDVGAELLCHLANRRGEPAGSAVGYRVVQTPVAGLDDDVDQALLHDRVTDLHRRAQRCLRSRPPSSGRRTSPLQHRRGRRRLQAPRSNRRAVVRWGANRSVVPRGNRRRRAAWWCRRGRERSPRRWWARRILLP